MKNILAITKLMALSTLFAISTVSANDAQPKRAKTSQLTKATFVKPALCANGYKVINKNLVQHEGKKWYTYQCVQQQNIKPKCNADTDVTKVKNNIVGKPHDKVNHDFKIMMSYECSRYIPVE